MDNNNDENLLEVKKWSLLSEEEKKFYVNNFLVSYKEYTKTKVFTNLKSRLKIFSISGFISGIVRTYLSYFIIFSILFIFAILFDIFTALILLIVFIIIYELYSVGKNVASMKERISSRKSKAEMFVEYLSENKVVLDTDVKPSMILELYKD